MVLGDGSGAIILNQLKGAVSYSRQILTRLRLAKNKFIRCRIGGQMLVHY